MFHVTYTGVYSGRAMARFALSKPNAKKVVLVAHTNDWAKGYCDPATELMKEQGIEPVMSLALERGSTDATAQSLRIKTASADFVLGCLYEAELAILLRDLHKYGVSGAGHRRAGRRLREHPQAGEQPGRGEELLPAVPVQGSRWAARR